MGVEEMAIHVIEWVFAMGFLWLGYALFENHRSDIKRLINDNSKQVIIGACIVLAAFILAVSNRYSYVQSGGYVHQVFDRFTGHVSKPVVE